MKHYLIRGLVTAGILLAAGISMAQISYAEETSLQEPSYLYKTTFVRAAPGKLLDLIDLYKEVIVGYEEAGDSPPFWWRHTQGDQWDLMLLFPMGSYEEFYSAERTAKRKKAQDQSSLPPDIFKERFQSFSAWHEDLFVWGPPLEKVTREFDGSGYFHIEIFISLPGKHKELYKERQMENVYQMGQGRPENMIFVRDQGAAWDIYTLGCYRNQMHWAEGSGFSREDREALAKKAGFESAAAIGPYMRTLIYLHRDTMGVAIR